MVSEKSLRKPDRAAVCCGGDRSEGGGDRSEGGGESEEKKEGQEGRGEKEGGVKNETI